MNAINSIVVFLLFNARPNNTNIDKLTNKIAILVLAFAAVHKKFIWNIKKREAKKLYKSPMYFLVKEKMINGDIEYNKQYKTLKRNSLGTFKIEWYSVGKIVTLKQRFTKSFPCMNQWRFDEISWKK